MLKGIALSFSHPPSGEQVPPNGPELKLAWQRDHLQQGRKFDGPRQEPGSAPKTNGEI